MPVLVTDWVNRNEILQSVVVVPRMRQKKKLISKTRMKLLKIPSLYIIDSSIIFFICRNIKSYKERTECPKDFLKMQHLRK